MPLLYYVTKELNLNFAPNTPLTEIVNFMGNMVKNDGLQGKSSFVSESHTLEMHSRRVESNTRKLIPSPSYVVEEKSTEIENFIHVDCIFIVEKLKLLGILRLADLKQLIASKINLAIVKIAEVMREPIVTLPDNFDINTAMRLMRQYSLYHLPVINDMGVLLGIVTPESIIAGLQKELSNTSKQLQGEIAQRCSLEIALKKAKDKLADRNTAYKQAENKLKISLREKEILLKEIHHRVKNNLQILSSLLRIKARHIIDEQALDIFRDSQNRIQAIAITHESMSQSHNSESIIFSDYVHNLITHLLISYGVTPHIKIHLHIEQVLLKFDAAVCCGLIINELICNAIKHAFSFRDIGNIYISFYALEQNQYSLDISDDGVGLPQEIEVPPKQSIGLQIVWSLVEQLEGTIKLNSNQLGTMFTIKFVMQN